ncbi:unnamed protein product [Coregonus sp. 'balchen']|nr:unnamed protein product [Coregonus sp. 'balchen']
MEMDRGKVSDRYQANLNRVLTGTPLPLHPIPLPLHVHTRLSSGSSSSPCTPAMQRAAIQQNANLGSSRDAPHSSSMSDMATTPMSPTFDDVFWDFPSSVEHPPKVGYFKLESPLLQSRLQQYKKSKEISPGALLQQHVSICLLSPS